MNINTKPPLSGEIHYDITESGLVTNHLNPSTTPDIVISQLISPDSGGFVML